MNVKLFFRKLVGVIAKPFSAGYSECGHCHRTWNICEPHTTSYSACRGCFPLCEQCWSELTKEERLPYYMKLVDEWKKSGTDESYYEAIRLDIKNAVMTEVPQVREKLSRAERRCNRVVTSTQHDYKVIRATAIVLCILCIVLRILL